MDQIERITHMEEILDEAAGCSAGRQAGGCF